MPDSKVCRVCGVDTPLEDLVKAKRASDGRAARCKKCTAKATAEWRAKNPERARAANRRWREANADKVREDKKRWWAENGKNRKSNPYNPETHRAWLERNMEKKLEYNRQWRAANPDRYSTYHHERRAHLRNLKVEPIDFVALWNGLCGICGGTMTREHKRPHPLSPSLDHIIPISKGGAHTQENLQYAHLTCNMRKGAKMPDEFVVKAVFNG